VATGKSVGSKIDRHGSTHAERHEAIKAAAKSASRAGKELSRSFSMSEKSVAGSALSQSSKGGKKR